MEEKIKDELFKTFEYREISVPIYIDDYGQQFYTILDGEEIGFGAYNTNYEYDLKYIIDEKLDFIYSFKEYPGASLHYFFNGYADRDIKLTYKNNRILKVFLIETDEVTEEQLKQIKEESLKILSQIAEIKSRKVV